MSNESFDKRDLGWFATSKNVPDPATPASAAQAAKRDGVVYHIGKECACTESPCPCECHVSLASAGEPGTHSPTDRALAKARNLDEQWTDFLCSANNRDVDPMELWVTFHAAALLEFHREEVERGTVAECFGAMNYRRDGVPLLGLSDSHVHSMCGMPSVIVRRVRVLKEGE